MKNPGTADSNTHVVIVGGGFGGLNAAKKLRRATVKVTLVDQRNHHLFQPLLYQVATAALNPSDIATPIRSILHSQKNLEVVLDRAVGVDRGAKKLLLENGELPYDYSSSPPAPPIPISDIRTGSPTPWAEEHRGCPGDPPPHSSLL